MSLDIDRREELRSALERGFYVKRAYFEALGLNYTKAAVYALIRSFSDNHSDGFSGSKKYLSLLIGVTERSISRALAELVARGLVERRVKRVNGTPHPAYFSDGSLENSLVEQYISAHTPAAKAESAPAAKAPAAEPYRQSAKPYEIGERLSTPCRKSTAARPSNYRQNVPYRQAAAEAEHSVKYSTATAEEMMRRAIARTYEE